MRIAVVGGTGVAGRLAVEEASERGIDAVPISRASGIDVTNGAGLDAAISGCDVVIDASNLVTLRRSAARHFFEASARQLQAAAKRSAVGHLVVLSIVGIDQVRAYGYYDAKLLQERLHLDGPVPATVVRATQFHEFAGQVLERSSLGPLAFVPELIVQTVAARAVAARLVDVAVAGPHRGRLADVAGPDASVSLPVLVRAVVARQALRRRVISVRPVGAVGRAVRAGALLPAADATITGDGFAEWLVGQDGPTVR